MHFPLPRSFRIVLCLIFGSALCSFAGDTINFDGYTAATALNTQDGWVWHDISNPDNVNDLKSVTFSGSDKVAACTTYGIGEQYRPVTSKSSTAELRWKWRADATTTKGAFGPCSTMSLTGGDWNAFRVRPVMNGSGAFSCKGAAFAATAGWPTYGLNKWYYMRLYMNIATNKYSLYLDSVSFAGTTETQLVNDSTMAHTASLAVSKIAFKGNTGVGGKIYIDSIMWSDPWTAAVVAKTWDGSSSANWNTAANWTGNTVPINNDTILFNSSSTANLSTTNDISSLTGLRIKVVDPTGAVSIGTNAIALGSSGIDMSAATQNLTISANVTMGAAQTWNVASSKTLTVSGTVTNSTYLLTVDGAGNTTVSNVIGNGAGGITKNGTGTLTLSATNTYTGATAVTAGVVNVQNAQGTGTTAGGVTVSSGAAQELQGGITVGAEALTLSGTGVSSNGALRNISGNNTWGGTITLNAATTIQSDADVLTLNAANAITATNQNLTIEGASGGTISGTITTGTGTLTKNDAGTWTLSGANTYSGTTTVSAGTLTLSNSSGSGTGTGGITINGGTLNGTGAASGAITLTTGILAGTQTFSGDLTGNGGTVSPAGASTVGTLTFTGGAGAVDLNSGCTYSANITGNATCDQLNVTGAVDITSSTLSLTLGYAPTLGHTYTIITNDDVDAITGTFTGLAEGAQTSADYSATTYYFTVSYVGGTGNDVVLTSSAAPAAQSDTVTFESGYTIGNTLDGQDGWVRSASEAANYIQIRQDGTNELARSKCGAVASHKRGFTSIATTDTLEIRWRWRAQSTGSYLAVGPMSDTTGGWNSWNNMRARLNMEAGSFNSKGANWVDRTGWPSYSANTWYYERAQFYGPTNKYSWWHATQSNLSDEVKLVNDSTMYGSAAAILAFRISPIASGTTDSIDVDDIEWRKYVAPTAKTWDGSSSANWNTAANWTGNTVPISNDTIVFNSSSIANLSTTNDISSLTGLRIKVVDPTGAVSIGTNAIALGSSGIDMSAATQNLTISANVTASSAQTWNVITDKTLALSGTTTFTGAVTKSGAGTLTLTGSNGGAGGVTLSAGTLNLGHNSALGTGTLTVSGAGTITANSAGIAASNAVAANADFTVGGSNTLTLSGTMTLGANRQATVSNSATTTFSGQITGGYTFTKAGTGTLILSGGNDYTGATTVSAGVLNIQHATGTGTTAGGVSVTNGAALEIQGGITVGAEALALNGTGISSNGALRNISGTNTWGGTLTLSTASTIQSDAGTLTLNAANAITATNQNLTLEGAGDGAISGTITTGTGTLTKNDAGTWTLSGANTYSGTTTISAGTLAANNVSGSGTGTGAIAIGGGTLQGTGSASGAVTLTTGTIAGTLTLSGDLTGNGGTVSPAGASTVGTLTLTGGAGAVDLNSGCTYSANITGNATCDQLNVTGAVDITSSTLSLTLGYAPTVGHTYTIIANDGTDAITGTFTGLAEGAQTTASYSGTTYYFTVSYVGGTDNNDVVLTNAATGSDDYSAWNFSQPIYLNTTPYGAGVTDTVTNFPVLVRLSPTTFAGFSNTEPSGADIRFAKSDGTHLAYEIERWVDGPSNADTAEVWVKVDSVFGNSDDKYFTMYWGKTGAADSSRSTVVFDTGNGFVSVWHLYDTTDATVFANKLSRKGTGEPASSGSGVVGGCQDFDGTDDYLVAANSASLDLADTLTASFWLKYEPGTAPSGHERILSRKVAYNNSNGWEITLDDADNTGLDILSGKTTSTAAADVVDSWSAGGWHYVAVQYIGALADVFGDGSLRNNDLSITPGAVDNDNALVFGDDVDYSEYNFDGKLDEVRLESAIRSAAWIKLCYENQKESQTLVDLENYSNWAYSQQIDINTSSTGAAVATAQTDFPLLVRLHKGNFTFTQAATGGADIRFADADGSHLAYEIERWDATNEAAEMWVRVPQVNGSSASDYVTMYWGRSGVSSKSNGAAVFDTANGFRGVWHMSGDPSSANITDVTSNSYDGVPANMVAGDSVSGVVGAALNFDGSTKYLNIGANSSILKNVGAATLSAWVNLDALPAGAGDYQIIHTSTNASATGNRAVLQVEGGDSLLNVEGRSADGDANQNGPSLTKMSTGSWTFVTGTFDYPNDQIKAYLNGALNNTTAATFGASATSDLVSLATFIGAESATTLLLDGRIDEVRVSKSLRSADWIKLTYETQKATSTVLDFENYAKWPYSRQLAFNTTSSSGGAGITGNVTDFPMLVRLHSGNFNFDLSSSDGSDIRFADPDGDHLHYEVERWDAAVDSAEVWVRVPQVDANSTSDYITMYWGLTGVPSRSNGKAVFDTAQGFAATYHLPSTNSYNDATGNLNNLTASASAPTESGGVIGKGRAFASASSQRLYINDNASVSLTGNITYSTWAKFTDLGTFRGLISKGLTESRFVFDDTYNLRIAANNTQYTSSSASSPSTNTWYHLSAAFNNTGDTVVFYVDGTKLGSTVAATGSPPDGTNALNIGADQSDDYMNGALDEPRLERSYRSADWIKLCYKTQKAPDSVINYGTSNGNWTYSKKIWFNTTSGGANVRTNVSNFPTLVRLNSTNFNFDQAQSAGQDIRFADASGNQLAYELERWTSVNDSAEIWVKVPLIKGDRRETYVTMQWGNAVASSASNGAAVFDTGNGFVGVWHLNESGDGTAGEFEDATTLGHDGRGRASNVPAQASGMIGYSQNFSVAGQGIIVPNTAYMGGFPELTISLWVKQRSSGVSTTYGRWFTYGDGNPYRYSHYTSGGTHRSEFGINGTTWGATNNSAGFDPTTPVWRHMVATYDGSMRSAYRDGVNTDTATLVGGGAINASADSALIIGNRNVSGGVFNRTTDGFIDEVRLEKTARSDAWVKLCYENQRADQTLLDFEDYTDWSYSKNITINTSGMGLSGNVTKFPLLVRLRHTDFTFSQSATPASGPDIRFAKPDGTHLSYEIERWVYNTGVADSADIWVLVDTVQQNSSSQYVKMHWGKSSVASKSSAVAVFDTGNGFAGVWHMDQDPSAGNQSDITQNTYDGVSGTGMTAADLVDGPIGNAIDFDKTNNDSIGIGSNSAILQSASAATLSAWVKPTTITGTDDHKIIHVSSGTSATANRASIYLKSSGSLRGGGRSADGDGHQYDSTLAGTIGTDGWYHVAATYHYDPTDDIKLYINGEAHATRVAVNFGSGTTSNAASLASVLGAGCGESPFHGIIDETRASKVARSADWIKLCYETQVIGGSAVSAEQEQLLPITVAATATQCSVYTDKWTLVFDKSTGKGGGIEILTDSSHALSSGQANQLGATQNLFYVDHAGTTTKATGAWTLLTTSGTGQAIAAIRQNATLANLPFEIDYTVHGSGKLFVKATAHNTTGSPISGATLRFMTERRPVTTVSIANAHAQAKLSPYVLMSSDSSGHFDLLLSPFTMWNSDSGFASNATVFDTSRSSGYAGYKSTSFALASGQKEIWEFMLDFSHKAWNDTSGVGKYASDYRRPDSLEFIAGVPVLEQAWENKLRGHWKLDEGTGDSLRDNSGNLKNGYKSGGTWTAGKWGHALNLTAAQKGIVAHHSDFSAMGTIMAWVKPSSTLGATSIIYGKYSSAPAGVKLIGDAGAPAFVINGSTVATASASIGTGVWHHVAVSFNSSAIQIYIDGRLNTIAASGPYSVTWPTTSVVLGEGFAGDLDDVRFYNEIISNSTIKSIYQRGYRSSQGIYQIRAENNNSAHFRIDGGTLRRSFPVFQIANYWASALPAAGCVALNGTALSAAGGDYVATLDDGNNVLTIGINRAISTDSARIYIDDNSSSGVSLITPTKRMVWGTHSTPNSHFWVKNFTSNNFGASGDKQFFIDWKMDSSASSYDGEIWNWKSSYTSAGASADTSSTGNLLPTTVDNDWGLGTFTATLDGTNWGSSNRDMTGAVPSYTVMDSSEVRVSFRLAPRTITKSSRSFSITTQYTIYPTGQIFRWDSLAALTHSMSSSRWVFGAKYVADSSVYVSTSGMRGAVHSTTGMQDFAAAFLRHRDGGGATTATPWNGDIMADGSAVSSRLAFRFTNAGGDGTNWTTGDAPMQIACYMDIQRSAMNTTYVDSVGKGVQIINAPIMSAGTLVLTSAGDLNGDGFNEREGAYVLQASNNAVNFRLPARGDTCRFNPAFRITNYNASNRPQYVFAYRGMANGDTVLLAEGYHFNSYLKKASNELIMQLDTVACDTMGIYISADQTLAVTMSNFRGVGGDGADTLFWRTESEQDNLGFNLYRRYKPRFLDSLARAADTTKADSLLDNPGRLLKMGKVTPIDTGWVLVNRRIIPGSRTGASYGPRDYRWIDRVVHNDMLYEYRLVSIDYKGAEDAFGPIDVMPRAIYPVAFKLHFNYPNPFRHITTIRYDLPVRTRVMLNVYTLQGRLVRRLVTPDLRHNPGFYRITWDGRDDFGRGVASGPYVYRIATPRFARAKIMILAR